MSAEFLLELLCEEIPAGALPGIRSQLVDAFTEQLHGAGYDDAAVEALSTVRRLVVHVAGLTDTQPDREEEVTGPPVAAAYTSDGTPTAAALGFAKGQGVDVGALRVIEGPKGKVVATIKKLAGKPTADVLGEIAPAIVAALHIPKTMRWGTGEHTFVRPLHNIVALFGSGTFTGLVPMALFGVESATHTVGHRVVAPGRIELKGARGFLAYLDTLAKAGVVIHPDERRKRIEARAAALAREVGCDVRPDPELLGELVELVESPGVNRGEIAAKYLELPEEVLITTLRHHQKCLVLTREGRVAPYFLAVADRPNDPQGLVTRGNEWVAGARLADAAFFFEHDCRKPLAARYDQLGRVMFHQKLGSFQKKAEVVEALAIEVARAGGLPIDEERVTRACRLLKADLVTAMVGEFPELQGVMGGIYARRDGEDESVWQAVADQYLPAGLEGPLPRGELAALVGVADRLDAIAGMFAVGETPSGSKDPFALRRAAGAVVRIAAEAPLLCDLKDAAGKALALRTAGADGGAGSDGLCEKLHDFLRDRERHYLTAVVGVSGDVADAVMAARWGVVSEDVARARALEAVRREDVFASLAVAFKRVRNMVAKGGAEKAGAKALVEPAEKSLAASLSSIESEVESALAGRDFGAALRALGALAAPLDRFFTDVLVLCEDPALRAARLGLLARVEELFLRLADVSRLSAQ